MNELALRTYVRVRAGAVTWRSWADERGEGVISAAIAVLIMAFLGAGMWLAFNQIFQDTAKNTCEQTNKIGNPTSPGNCDSVGR